MSAKSQNYIYEPTDNSWHYVEGTVSHEMKVSDSSAQSKLDQIITNTASSGGDASASNQLTMISSLSEIESAVDTTNDRMKVSLETQTAGLSLESTGQSSLSELQTISSINSSLDTKILACDTGSVSVSSSVLPTGGSTSLLQGTGNSLLSSLDTKIVACDTSALSTESTLSSVLSASNDVASTVNVATSRLKVEVNENNAGLSTSQKQDDIITKLDALNDGSNTLESFTMSASSFQNTTSKNTNNYSKYSVLVNSTQNDTALVIQASQNNTDWYYVDYYTTVNEFFDADGLSNSQNNYISYSSIVNAKYMRVRLYAPTGADVKVSFNLVH